MERSAAVWWTNTPPFRSQPSRAEARSSTSTWPGPDQRGLSRLMQVTTGTCAPSMRATHCFFCFGAQVPSGRPVRMVGWWGSQKRHSASASCMNASIS